METEVVFKATKKEILDLLRLLAHISSCCTRVDKGQKALIITTALNAEIRNLGNIAEYNKQLEKLRNDGFGAIVNAQELVLLDE